jgi:hypothetical protein
MDIFINASELIQIKSLVEFYQKIDGLRSNTTCNQPYNFNLCPVIDLSKVPELKTCQYHEIPTGVTSSYESSLLKLFQDIDRSRQCLKHFNEIIEMDRAKLKEWEENILEPIKQ